MTTREALRRQWNRAYVCWLVLLAGSVVSQHYVLKGSTAEWMLRMITIVGYMLVAFMVGRVQCVHCSTPLGWKAWQWAPPQSQHYSPRCPVCEASIDQ